MNCFIQQGYEQNNNSPKLGCFWYLYKQEKRKSEQRLNHHLSHPVINRALHWEMILLKIVLWFIPRDMSSCCHLEIQAAAILACPFFRSYSSDLCGRQAAGAYCLHWWLSEVNPDGSILGTRGFSVRGVRLMLMLVCLVTRQCFGSLLDLLAKIKCVSVLISWISDTSSILWGQYITQMLDLENRIGACSTYLVCGPSVTAST